MLDIRTADVDGVALLLDWAKAEGWNPGLHDAAAFHAADPQGFLLGYLDGELASGISVVAAGESFGFLGLYIVSPVHRGKGLGFKTWQAGLAKLANRSIGLDGVVAQQANYARSGFALAHRSIRFQGKRQVQSKTNTHAQPVEAHHINHIANFDARHYGAIRTSFIEHWLDGSGGRHARAVFDQQQVAGYGVIRPCHAGWKIGPLFANTSTVAENLLSDLMQCAGDDHVTIDMPEPNTEGLRLLQRHGFTPVFETARMYRGTAPTLPLQNIYGLTSFELG